LPGSTIVRPARYRTSNRAGGSRAGDRNAHTQSAISSRPSQLLRNRSCVAEQPRQAVQIQHDLVGLQTSMRGENSRATSASTVAEAPSAVINAPNTDHLFAAVHSAS
jgi:hypothetical protein